MSEIISNVYVAIKERGELSTRIIASIYFKKNLIFSSDISIICNKCRHVYRKERSKFIPQNAQGSDSDDNFQLQGHSTSTKTAIQNSPPSISLPIFPISSTEKSQAYCFICKRPDHKFAVQTFCSSKYSDCKRKSMLY